MDRRPLPGRRAEICRTAARIIRERGFEATSLADIARALGLSKSGLYHYTNSKHALLFEIITFGMDQIDAEVVTPVRGIADPEERLYEVVNRHIRIATRAGGAVAQLADEIRALPAANRRKVQQRMRKYVAFVHAIVDELAAAGRLRAIDTTVATYLVMGSILWVPRWFREGGRLTAAQVAYEVAWSTVDALRRRPAGFTPRAVSLGRDRSRNEAHSASRSDKRRLS
jgi:TetR/AcrR family transcriptional regulator, cholesterol catabolism regulator